MGEGEFSKDSKGGVVAVVEVVGHGVGEIAAGHSFCETESLNGFFNESFWVGLGVLASLDEMRGDIGG